MRTFTVRGQFEAEDIDDAIEKLAQHFRSLAAEGLDAPPSQFIHYIEVKPLTKEET